MPSPIEVFAPAKINLFLHVGDRRADGFHALESLVVFVDAGDVLRFAPADELSLSLDGPFGAALQAEADNLVLRAGRALAAQAGIRAGAAITLAKNLPVASGIGGGSADAAAALRGLAQLWKLDVPREDLLKIAATLGSDVPVCVESRSAWMEGRGEIVTPASGLPPAWLVLVNPRVAVPTGPVFKALTARTGVGKARRGGFGGEARALADYLAATANDLEAPALGIAPVIGEVLAALKAKPGTLLARMSGSGATCFALFGDADAANAASAAIKAVHDAWWVQPARVLG